MFGYGREQDGTVIKPETLGRIAEAFAADGVRCEIAWLHLPFNTFVHELTTTNPTLRRTSRRAALSETPTPGWRFTEENLLPDLVELRLHPPRAGNELADWYYVDATLLFGTAEHDYLPEDGSDPRTVAIALRKALLTIGSPSYRPLKDSMLGERTESDHYRRVAGGVEIIGPAPEGTLQGNPAGGDHLAVIAGTGTGEEPFGVSVAANWGSFVVTDANVPGLAAGANQPSANKAAILNALIHKQAAKDAAGRAVLARATMQPPPQDADAAP